MIIPKDVVSAKTPFRIKQTSKIQLPENITPVTVVYEVEPHNVQVQDFVHLTFTLQETSQPVALFLQKDNLQDKELNKWLVIDPKEIKSHTATFELRSFGFSFVGQMNLRNVGSASSSSYIIRPGLNYRAVCEDPSCSELMIINRGFGEFVPVSELDDEKLKCSKCSTILTSSASIKQLVLFQTTGEIQYRLDKTPQPPAQSAELTAINDQIIIYGDPCGDRYSTLKITVNEI